MRLGRWKERLAHLPVLEGLEARAREAADRAEGEGAEELRELREQIVELRVLETSVQREERALTTVQETFLTAWVAARR